MSKNNTSEQKLNNTPEHKSNSASASLISMLVMMLWPMALQVFVGDIIRTLLSFLLSKKEGISDVSELSLIFTQKGYGLLSSLILAMVMIPVFQIMLLADSNKGRNKGVLLLAFSTKDTAEQKAVTPLRFICVILFAVSCAIGFNQLINLIGLRSLSPGYRTATQVLFAGSIWLRIATSVLAVPICEELLFRGVLYHRMRLFTGVWASALFTAVLFGLYHYNLVQFVYAAILGIVLAFLMEAFRSLWIPILFHMVANLTVILAEYAKILSEPLTVWLSCILGLLGSVLFGYLLYLSVSRSNPTE